MLISLYFLILLQICLADLRLNSDTCENIDNNRTKSADNYHIVLTTNSIMYDLVSLADDIDNLSSRCKADLKLIEEGIHRKSMWAFKLVDSSAIPASGFLSGNNLWHGSRGQCEYVSKKIVFNLSNRLKRNMKEDLMNDIAPFEVKYRIVHAKHNSPIQVQINVMTENTLQIGLCLPKECSNQEIYFLTQKLLNKKDAQSLKDYKMTAEVLEVKDLMLSTLFFAKKSLWILLICIFCVVLSSKSANTLQKHMKTDTNNNMLSEDIGRDLKPSRFDEFVKLFHYKENKMKIFQREVDPLAIKSISGLRSMSCYVLAISHVCTFMHFTLTNKVAYLSATENILGMLIINSALLVDGFFVISSFLTATNFLRDVASVEEIKSNNLLTNFKIYMRLFLQRYLRLTPLLILAMLTSEVVSSLLNDLSPHTLFLRNDLTCTKFWWRNIFYIQNFFPEDEMCVLWSWSLACDLQFFAIVTLILMIYVRNPQTGERLLDSLFLGFTLLSVFMHISNDFTLQLDVMISLLSKVYIQPFARICPYFVGTKIAIMLHRNGGKLILSKKETSWMWFLCGLFCSSLFLELFYFKNSSTFVASALKILAHLKMAFIFGWIIIADSSGYKNSFIRFLSKDFFIRFGRITYAFYLLTPIVTILIYGLSENGSSYNVPEIIVMSYVIMKITGRISFLSTVYFEVPFNKLSKKILRKQQKSKHWNEAQGDQNNM